MQVGVVFPQTELGADPAVLRDYAQTAEQLGFSHIVAYDHVLGAEHAGRAVPFEGPYTEESAFHEPLTLFAYLAAVTQRIGFMTGVLIVTQRQTALVAKQAAEVTLLSGNRLRLGIGTGWNYVEYESLGVPYRGRGRRQEEQVEVLRRLWTEPVVDFSGRYHRIDRAGIRPLPSTPIPIWFGGYSDVVFERTARIGDGFFFSRLSSLAVSAIDRIRSQAVELGRNPQDIGFEIQIRLDVSSEVMSAALQRWADAGGTHACISTMGMGIASPEDHIRALRDAAGAMAMARA
jgi:probable F420-dependent oxidoreductase